MTDNMSALIEWAKHNGATEIGPNTQFGWTGWDQKVHPTHESGVFLRIDANRVFHPVISIYSMPGSRGTVLIPVNISEAVRRYLLETIPVINVDEFLHPFDAALKGAVVRIGTNGLYLAPEKGDLEIVNAWVPSLRQKPQRAETIRIKGVNTPLSIKQEGGITGLRAFSGGSPKPLWALTITEPKAPVKMFESSYDDLESLFSKIVNDPGLIGAYEKKTGRAHRIPEEYLRGRMNALAATIDPWAIARNEEVRVDDIIEQAVTKLLPPLREISEEEEAC